MLHEILIGVDPGLVTGLAVLANIDDEEGVGMSQTGPMNAVARIESVLLRYGREHSTCLIVERYDITPLTAKISVQRDALDVIGALRYLCHRYGQTMVLQHRAVRKRVTEDMLRQSLMWRDGMEHANDAARHLFAHLADTQPQHPRVLRALGA